MRRPAAALLGTIAGTVLLVGAKYGTAPTQAGTAATAPVDPAAAVASGDPAVDPSPVPGSAGPSGAAVTGAPAPSGKPAPTRSAGTPAPTRSTAAPTSAAPSCTKATGNAVGVGEPGIGTITVTITVCNGVISTSTGVQSASNWDKNKPAVPALNQLAVRYYKSDFSAIHYSGASLTSKAYQASLRSAMSRAGI